MNTALQTLENSSMRLARLLTATGVRLVFDPKVKTPMADLENGAILIPLLPDKMTPESFTRLRGSIDHECAHVLFTKKTDGSYALKPKDEIRGQIANCIEDARINRLMESEYFGSRKNIGDFYQLTHTDTIKKILKDLEADGVDEKTKHSYKALLALMKASFLHTWKRPEVANIVPSDAVNDHMKSLPKDLRAQLQSIETYEDVENAIDPVMDWLGFNNPESPNDGENDDEDSEGQGESENNDSEGQESAQDDAKESEGDEDKDKGSDDDSESTDGENGSSDENDDSDGSGESDQSDSEGDTESEGESSPEKNESETDKPNGKPKNSGEKETEETDVNIETPTSNDGRGQQSEGQGGRIDPVDFLRIADEMQNAIELKTRIDPKDFVGVHYLVDTSHDVEVHIRDLQKKRVRNGTGEYTAKDANELFSGHRDKVSALRTRLIMDLQSTGKAWVRDLQRGRVMDTSSLHRTLVGDDRVFKNKRYKEKVDTAVSLVVDCSGSMQGKRIKHALQLAALFCEALELANVPCEVVGFTTGGWIPSNKHLSRDEKLVHIIFKAFNERVMTHRSDWPAVYDITCNNVDGESIFWAARRLAKQKTQRKVMMVLSDGFPSAHARGLHEHLKETVKLLEKAEIEVLGVGIESDAVERFYPKYAIYGGLSSLMTGVYKTISTLLRKGRLKTYAA